MKLTAFLSPLTAGFLIVSALSLVADDRSALYAVVPIKSYHMYQSGDLVFRQGVDAVSVAVLATKPLSQYSHIGLIMLKGKQVLVIHAAPAEDKLEVDGVKIETLALFSQSNRATHIAVMRVSNDRAIGKLATKNALKYLGRPFDTAFNLQNEDSIYCTELVARAYLPLQINLIVKLQKINLPFVKGNYLIPQDVFEKANLMKVAIF